MKWPKRIFRGDPESERRSPNRIIYFRLGEVDVSTIRLLINHGTASEPLWFETMIFGGLHDGYQSRAATLDEAKAHHIDAMALVAREIRFLAI